MKYIWSITIKVEEEESRRAVAVSTHQTSPIECEPTDADRASLRYIEETAWRAVLTRLQHAIQRIQTPVLK